MRIRCRCSDCRDPGDARHSGKLAAMGTGDMAHLYHTLWVKLCACLGYVGACLCSFHPFRLSQISCFTPREPQMPPFSVPTNCSDVGISPLLQPPTPGAGPALLTPLLFPFLPSSYSVLCGAIYSSLLVRGFLLGDVEPLKSMQRNGT